jgi:hypothetical protein
MNEPVMTIEEAAFSVPVACSECGRQTDPRASGVRFEVIGWAQRGKRGGFTATSMLVGTNRLICASCFQRLKQTGNAAQGRLA